MQDLLQTSFSQAVEHTLRIRHGQAASTSLRARGLHAGDNDAEAVGTAGVAGTGAAFGGVLGVGWGRAAELRCCRSLHAGPCLGVQWLKLIGASSSPVLLQAGMVCGT